MLLREIEVFRSVMSVGSASKAAALLGVTQPAISQSLRRLEEAAGFPLFRRLRGRLQPTPEAQALLVEVERVFVGLSSIEHRMRSLKRFGVNTLRMAVYPAFGLTFVPACCRGWCPSAAIPKTVPRYRCRCSVRGRCTRPCWAARSTSD